MPATAVRSSLRNCATSASRLEIIPVEWADWLKQVFTDKDYDLSIVSHTEPNDIDIYSRKDYYFNYDNPAFDKVIEELNLTSDEAKRKELYGQAQKILADDAVVGFLFELPKIGIWDAKVEGPVGELADPGERPDQGEVGGLTMRSASPSRAGQSHTGGEGQSPPLRFASQTTSPPARGRGRRAKRAAGLPLPRRRGRGGARSATEWGSTRALCDCPASTRSGAGRPARQAASGATP